MTVPLHTVLDGPADAPALVLLNSIGTTTVTWEAQISALAEEFRVIRIDARGHGHSSPAPAGATTIADLGTDVLTVLDRLGVDRAHLAGLSLGGMTALWIATHHPNRISRLALLCTSAHPGRPDTWLERAAAVRDSGFSGITEQVVSRWITPELRQRDPVLVQTLAAQLAGTDPESYAQCCEVLAHLDLRPDLTRVAAPTLIIAGAQDQALPVDHARFSAPVSAGHGWKY
ncbi:MAG: alpha/beta fold hydrolase [Frankia sp.]